MYFINNTTVNLVSGLIAARTWCDKLVKKINNNLWEKGSLPNKLLMLGLNSAAAYAVGVHPAYIGVLIIVTTFFCLNTTPRWMLEAAVNTNLVLIAASTLPEVNVTQLEYLLLLKLAFELVCVIFDKLTQIYAAMTADQAHSYYFMWQLFTWGIAFAVTNSLPFINGFVDGFQAGISGM